MFHRSENLFLRPAFPEDWKAVHAGIARAEIVRNLATAPWPYAPDDARAFAQLPQDPWVPHFLIELPGKGVIGSAGLGHDQATGEVHLGYWIANPWHGRGFATEAARGVIAVARAIGHKRLTASHFIDNPASGRVLAKAGFRRTGEVRPGYSLARGAYGPVACYELALDCEDGERAAQPDDPAPMQRAA